MARGIELQAALTPTFTFGEYHNVIVWDEDGTWIVEQDTGACYQTVKRFCDKQAAIDFAKTLVA